MNKVVKIVAAAAVEVVVIGGVLAAAAGHVSSICGSCGERVFNVKMTAGECSPCYEYNAFVAPYLPDMSTAETDKAGN